MNIKTESIQIPLEGGGVMGGCLARPDDGEVRPAILVFMEIFGINAHIRDVAARLAREGYVALAPDFFHRTGPGVEFGYDAKGLERGMALLNQLEADEMIADARAAIAWLEARPDVRRGRIGAIGFCIGGHMAYLSACETSVCCAASFYGGGIAAPSGPGGGPSTIGRTPKIKGRILCLFGDEDDYIPQDQVAAIEAALKGAGVNHEVVVYPGASHGFFCDQRDSYQAAAATDAWRRVKALFAEELAGDR